MDLDTLKKYSSGQLTPKQFLAVHREAGELLDLLNQNLYQGEMVASVADWPAVRRRPPRQFVALKTLMLATPLVLAGGVFFALESPMVALASGLVWLGLFAVIAVLQLITRERARKSREGRSVVVVTNRRLMRIWLDGTAEVQSFALADEAQSGDIVEPVPETVKLLLQLDLGKTSLN